MLSVPKQPREQQHVRAWRGEGPPFLHLAAAWSPNSGRFCPLTGNEKGGRETRDGHVDPSPGTEPEPSAGSMVLPFLSTWDEACGR